MKILRMESPSGLALPPQQSEPLSIAVDGRQLRDYYEAVLVREYNPVSISEHLLTRLTAQLAARADKLDAAREAVEEHSAHALIDVLAPSSAASDAPAANLVSAIGSERIDALTHQSLAASKALFRGLRELRALNETRRQAATRSLLEADPRFTTEAACYIHLLRRIRDGDVVCRRCGKAAGGYWIATRRAWQCAACHTQTCIRHGTVMARSHVLLTKWFHAVYILLSSPNVNANDLQHYIGIHRAPTVRVMKQKICAAMESENASQLLAGLDEVYLPAG